MLSRSGLVLYGRSGKGRSGKGRSGKGRSGKAFAATTVLLASLPALSGCGESNAIPAYGIACDPSDPECQIFDGGVEDSKARSKDGRADAPLDAVVGDTSPETSTEAATDAPMDDVNPDVRDAGGPDAHD
jgi:hypothetical protein